MSRMTLNSNVEGGKTSSPLEAEKEEKEMEPLAPSNDLDDHAPEKPHDDLDESQTDFMKIGVEDGKIVFINPNGEFDRDLVVSSGAEVLNSKNISDEEKQKWRTKLCSMFRLSTDSFNLKNQDFSEKIADEMQENVNLSSGLLNNLDHLNEVDSKNAYKGDHFGLNGEDWEELDGSNE